jgi:D-glycero-alpha-D-manno-heptose-7-phosphate kinase
MSLSLGNKGCSNKEILHLAYHLEDSISGGNCGIQDQAAAVYGGVHQWEWHYGNRTAPLQKTSLLNGEGREELSKRLLVAYSGKSHTSSKTNNQWVEDFLWGKTRSGWIKANEIVRQFGKAIKALKWNRAASLLREEMSIRREITPEALTPFTKKLIAEAEDAGCGARFAGAGAGGSLWAVGKIERIGQLKARWGTTLARIKDAKILDCKIDPAGVR